MKICSNCGSKVSNDKKICTSCGEDLIIKKEVNSLDHEMYTAISITCLILALILSLKLVFNLGFMLNEVRTFNIINRIAFILWKIVPASIFLLFGKLINRNNKVVHILSSIIVCILILITTVIIFK